MNTDQPIRICVTMAGCSRLQGGLYHSVRRLWQAVERTGAQVQVKAVEDAYTEEDSGAYAPLPVKIFRCIGPQRLSYSPQMIEYMQAQGGQHDLISSHGFWSYADYAAWKASQFLDLPHLIHPHGMLDQWAIRNSSLKKRAASFIFQSKAMKQAACIRALCKPEFEAIRQYGYQGPIATIPNGVDLESLRSASCEATKEKIATISNGRKILLFLSRIHPKKNLPALLSAWKHLVKRHPNWLLVLAGPDELSHQKQLQEFVRTNELDQSVIFAGPLYDAEKTEWLRQSDLFVLPSKSEGFPMVLLEAAGMGLPILQTPQCNFPELTAAGGALECETSAKDIAAKLNQLMKLDDAERQQIGKKGTELVEANYSWDQIAEKMNTLCRFIFEGGASPEFVSHD